MGGSRLSKAPTHSNNLIQSGISLLTSILFLGLFSKGGILASVWTLLQGNIAKYRDIKQSDSLPAVVFARYKIKSESNQKKKLLFGYSDRISVYLNGELLFSGDCRWKICDPLFNGIV